MDSLYRFSTRRRVRPLVNFLAKAYATLTIVDRQLEFEQVVLDHLHGTLVELNTVLAEHVRDVNKAFQRSAR